MVSAENQNLPEEFAKDNRRASTTIAGAIFAPHDQNWFGFEVSHPSDKDKDVARMGHPSVGHSTVTR